MGGCRGMWVSVRVSGSDRVLGSQLDLGLGLGVWVYGCIVDRCVGVGAWVHGCMGLF